MTGESYERTGSPIVTNGVLSRAQPVDSQVGYKFAGVEGRYSEF